MDKVNVWDLQEGWYWTRADPNSMVRSKEAMVVKLTSFGPGMLGVTVPGGPDTLWAIHDFVVWYGPVIKPEGL